MSVTKEFILLAAGLIITVSLIFIGFGVYRKAASVGIMLADKQEKKMNDIAEYELMKYENTDVNGSKVIKYIQQVSTEYDVGINITVANPDLYTYRLSEISSFSELRDISSPYFINPLKLYKITVKKDVNAVLDSIEIEQIMED